MDNDEKLLNKYGWEIECESPFEIRHEDGSFAKMQAAHTVLESIKEEEKNNKICMEDGCMADAVYDYNGHGYWVCERHFDLLNEEFDNEYQ